MIPGVKGQKTRSTNRPILNSPRTSIEFAQGPSSNICYPFFEADSLMVECSGGEHCEDGWWFHIECLGMTREDMPDGDWWCSERCRKYSMYCYCKRITDEPLSVMCSNNHCVGFKRFHAQCITIHSLFAPSKYIYIYFFF